MPATLKSRFPEIVASIPLRVGEAIRSSAEDMARDASDRAPVAADYANGFPPGTLKRSIEAKAGGRRFSAFGDTGALAQAGMLEGLGIGKSGAQVYGIYAAWYWYFPEYGTRFFAGEPFMLPAAEAGIPELLAKVKTVVSTL